jgi:DNA-binding beta-propeller fold protein YncE
MGNVWTVDNGYSTVTKFSPTGTALMTIGVQGQQGDAPGLLNQPTDVAVTAGGDIFISDGYGNDRVVHYDRNGRFVKSWGQLGTGPGEFSLPHGIAADSKGRLYVADRNNSRVQVFDQGGKYIAEWRDIVTPWAIWITPDDEVYVAASAPSLWWETPGSRSNGLGSAKDRMVVRFDTDGRVQQLWSFARTLPGQQPKAGDVNSVHGIAVAPNGDIYLADLSGRGAVKFSRVASEAPLPTGRGR